MNYLVASILCGLAAFIIMKLFEPIRKRQYAKIIVRESAKYYGRK